MAIDKYAVSHPNGIIKGQIHLEGSKSISNRVLLIRALCNENFTIDHLSPSDDTAVLNEALTNPSAEYNMGHAGTSFRFLTAFLAITPGIQKITGSQRMLERPIGALVEALNYIGANITYEKKEGYPPLQIGAFTQQKNKRVTIDAGISSQFISALCLIAPRLPQGLEIVLDGELVSKSYIDMTLAIMSTFGIESSWDNNSITILPQDYIAQDFIVEADWSAASYYYIVAALSKTCELEIKGLSENSLQGDQAIHKLAFNFGVSSKFQDELLYLEKNHELPSVLIENNFLTHPDIAQSVVSICAGLGTKGLFSGLQTLAIKETDRTAALKKELLKLEVHFNKLPIQKFSQKSREEYFMLDGKSKSDKEVVIETYKDHRMAMAFAPLGLLHNIVIEDPMVVSKSYPGYWEDLKQIGFEIS